MSRATATLLATLDEIDPGGRIAGDEVLLDELPRRPSAANDELPLAPALGSAATETTVALTTTAGEAPTMALTTWIDALALTLAAGLRVGASGLLSRQSQANAEPEVMDADEVAAYLRVDRKTVYEYAMRAVIPHRRLGKRLLFSRTALVAWLGGNQTGSAKE